MKITTDCGQPCTVRQHRLGRTADGSREEAADARRLEGRDRGPEGRQGRLARDRLEELFARRAEGVGAKNKPALLWVFIDRPIDDARC